MKYKLQEDDTFFSKEEQLNLAKQTKNLFSILNKKFCSFVEFEDLKPVYFDEILIVKKENDELTILFHFFENDKIREELNYKNLNIIIEELVTNSPYDMYLFLKDQAELNFDFITRGKFKDENVLILLNNIEFSLDELQSLYPLAWKGMNEINSRLYSILRGMLEKIFDNKNI